MTSLFDQLKLGPGNLIPAVVQDAENKDILMLAYMNVESLKLTIETGITHFWSRSRNCLWKKGETSGHTQEVQEILYDCDVDALVVKVKQNGPACHTGYRTCFYRLYQGEDKEPEIVSQKM